MGQKVKGYRRNAEYGKETRRRGKRRSWEEEVNPPLLTGWVSSGSERTEKGYGGEEVKGKERRKRVSEGRRAEGYETSGRGRKGNSARGYVVYGEYLKVSRGAKPLKKERGGEEAGEREEGRESRERKRGRRRRRYETVRGGKVTRERVDRAEVREGRGLRGERRERRGPRGRARQRRGTGRGAPRAKRDVKEERIWVQKEAERRNGALGAVVVLGGVRRIEGRRGKRRVRKRRTAGRDHRKVRREVSGLRTYHSLNSPQGRKAVGGKRGRRQGGYYGYRVVVQGPRNGSRRTTKTIRGNGTVPQGRKSGRRGEWEGVAKTSVGTRGVRVTYCYGLG